MSIMLFHRRAMLRGALLASALLASGLAAAQSGKTIRLLVGFPAGGGTDAIARVLAEHLKDELGAAVIVENKPGAGGQLAAQALKAAAPDGSTLFLSHDHSISILPQVVKAPGFDPAKDFLPVAGFATFVNAFAVSSGTPAKGFNEYVGWVQGAGGGKGAVGVPAPASVPEFLVKVIGDKYKLDLVAAPLPRQRTDDGRHAGQPNCRRCGFHSRLHREPQERQDPRRRRAGRRPPGGDARRAHLP